tara:strand:+ start:885 stop:1652 length:768 start_codon:yes stop_codon:yes gene_type:complete
MMMASKSCGEFGAVVNALSAPACAANRPEDGWTLLCGNVLHGLRLDCARVLGESWQRTLAAAAAAHADDDDAALCALWRRSSAERGCTVTLGQTETPEHIRDLLLARLPSLLCADGTVRSVLDPASGAGVLIGAAARRLGAKLFTLSRDAAHLRRSLDAMSVALCAVDVDEVSCLFTRLNLTCAAVPLLRAIAAAASATGDADECGDDVPRGRRGHWTLPQWSVHHGNALLLFATEKQGAAEAGLDEGLLALRGR